MFVSQLLCVFCCIPSDWKNEQRYPNGGCWILRIRKKAGQTNTSVLGKMWQVTDTLNSVILFVFIYNHELDEKVERGLRVPGRFFGELALWSDH